MAELKLMIERLSEREKTAIRNEIAQAERQAELAVLKAKEEAETTLVEEKEKITNNANNKDNNLVFIFITPFCFILFNF